MQIQQLKWIAQFDALMISLNAAHADWLVCSMQVTEWTTWEIPTLANMERKPSWKNASGKGSRIEI